jgi:hypothetical protein
LAQLAASYVVLWQVLIRQPPAARLDPTASNGLTVPLANLLAATLGCNAYEAAVQTLADGLAQLTGCRIVAVSVAEPRRHPPGSDFPSHLGRCRRRYRPCARRGAARGGVA